MAYEWKPLPIVGPPHQNLHDERELDVRAAQVMDAYVDEAGFTVKRPGLEPFTVTQGFSVDGLYWWDEAEKALAVVNSTLYTIDNATGSTTSVTSGLPLPAGNRVSFATTPDGSDVLMASGQNIVSTDGSTAAALGDADAPTAVRFVTVYDQYAIAAIEGTGLFAHSEVGDVTAWRAQDLASAEAKPDRIVSLLGTLDGFELFGKTSAEFWINDGVTPFSRVRGLTFNRGCGARYSPALYGDTWLWLDNNRTVVKSTVNKIDEVSGQIDRALHSLSSVEDAIGDVMLVNGLALYVLTFPLANRTFVYNIKQNDWTEWGEWNATNGEYLRFRGNSYCYATKWNKHLVGDKTSGNIYSLNRDYHYDVGSTLRSMRRTGFITHGTGNKKHCRELRFRLKRSVATSATPAPLMSVKWRNDSGAWEPTRLVSLGEAGQHELMVSLKQCGDYRTRQYEFSHADNTDWILMSGEENVEVRVR